VPGRPRAVIVAAVAVVLAGCGGTGTSGGAGAPGGAPTGGSTGSGGAGGSGGSSASCRTPTPTASGSSQVVRLTATDNGAAVCVSRGEVVEVDLAAPAGTPWSITAQGPALRKTAGGSGGGSRADSSAVFEAVAPGTASIQGARRACARPSGPGVACGAIQGYTVTVLVR
jgi:hypothetical protein